jgi:hypothetical protein
MADRGRVYAIGSISAIVIHFLFMRAMGAVKSTEIVPLELFLGLAAAQFYLGGTWARYVVGGWLSLIGVVSLYVVARSPVPPPTVPGAVIVLLPIAALVLGATVMFSKNVAEFLQRQRDARGPGVRLVSAASWIFTLAGFAVWVFIDILRARMF